VNFAGLLGVVLFLAFLVWTGLEERRMDAYVSDCRARGGWAVDVLWPDHRGWVQCARMDVISLPEDHGAKP